MIGRCTSWLLLGLEEAMAFLEEQRHPLPAVQDLGCFLQKCRQERQRNIALRLHDYLHDNGLEVDPAIGNPLVSLMVEVGSMSHALQVFDSLKHKHERSWNILITGHVKHGQPKLALSLYEKMERCTSLNTSGYSFAALLKACTVLKDANRGSMIHAEVVRKGMHCKDVFIGSTLVDMYIRLGSLTKAKEVFNKISARNLVVWTALITGLVEKGNVEEAISHLEEMQQEGIVMDPVTYICGLKACSCLGSTEKLRMLHIEIVKLGLEGEAVLGSTLVTAYAKCGLLEEAGGIFDNLKSKDIVSWTALISGYVDAGFEEEALHHFELMQMQGLSPGQVTLLASVRACVGLGLLLKGQEIHMDIIRKGVDKDLLVGSALIDMYAKCYSLADAQAVLYRLSDRNMISWTTLIAGYAEHGYGEQAIHCFDRMENEGTPPCLITFVSVLKACGSVGAIDKGQEIHAEIARKGLLGKEVFVGSILVDMYAKCGLLSKAAEVFDNLPMKNVVCWTALIGGYTEHGNGEEALTCFEEMQKQFVVPMSTTYVCSLKACSNEGFAMAGAEIHSDIISKALEADLVVGNAIIDMYVKCGLLLEARKVFERLEVRDVVSWTSLISGYAQAGRGEEALQVYNEMVTEGVLPNLVTFRSLLNACNHTGLVERSQTYVEALTNGYGFSPTLQHYSSMVDLLCRAGQVDKAAAMISKMPFCPGSVAWQSLLGACEKGVDLQPGRHAHEYVMGLDYEDYPVCI